MDKTGVNTVLIPVGYWVMETSPMPPFVGGAAHYLDLAFQWATAFGIRVVISLHAARGSQNGYDHSSPRDRCVHAGLVNKTFCTHTSPCCWRSMLVNILRLELYLYVGFSYFTCLPTPLWCSFVDWPNRKLGHIAHSLEVIEWLMKRYHAQPGFLGIELLNESTSWSVPMPVLQS